MSTKKDPFERRTDKLRASCDACYLAKVKCSKSRPLCQRCLVSGTNCAYSPSARFKRGSKTSGGDRLNEDAAAFRIQENSEVDIECNSSIVHFTSPSYQHHSSFNPDERYQIPTSTPCPGNWTSDLLLCTDPVLLFDGEDASEAYPDVDELGTPNRCFWWNNPSTMAGNLAESELNNNDMRLESSEVASPYCCSSWYQSPRSGPSQFPSNSLSMSSTPSSGAGTYFQLDYESFNATGEFQNLHLSQLKETSNTLQYKSQGQ